MRWKIQLSVTVMRKKLGCRVDDISKEKVDNLWDVAYRLGRKAN